MSEAEARRAAGQPGSGEDFADLLPAVGDFGRAVAPALVLPFLERQLDEKT